MLQRGITVGVTSFIRYEKTEQCLRSIWKFWPNASVILADNGNKDLSLEHLCPHTGRFRYVKLPFDEGLSACRNAIIDRVSTPFLLQMEDDFIVDERCNVAAMLDILHQAQDIGVVGGQHESGYRAGMRIPIPTVLEHCATKRIDLPKVRTANGNEYFYSEFASNFALFRMEMFQDHRWDESLKLGEHIEFYLRVKEANRWVVASTFASQIGHDKEDRKGDYSFYRRRGLAFRIEAKNKHEPASTRSRMMPPNPRCILVPTTGRSGSSLIAQMLVKMGVMMGHRLIKSQVKHNPHGYFEDQRWNPLLKSWSQNSPDAIRRIVTMRNLTQPLWGIKHPRIADHWDDLKSLPWPDDTSVVIPRRDIEKVILSLDRTGWGASRENGGRDVMEARRLCLDRIAEHANEKGWPVLEIEYEKMIESPREVVDGLANLVDPDISQELRDEIVELVDSKYNHFPSARK